MTTFLDLTNRLLRRINEAEITSSDFNNVRGLQATAKDVILDTIRKINNRRYDWPFNAVEHEQTLVVGTSEYAWPLRYTNVDWDSFQILKDDDLGVAHTNLTYIPRETWYEDHRNSDYDASTDGRDLPRYVFPAHGQGWGVTPSPNELYTIRFRYYKNPDDLEAYSDNCTLPARFDYVIIAGALYHLSLFKDNAESTMIGKNEFKEGMQEMISQLINQPQRQMYDTRV